LKRVLERNFGFAAFLGDDLVVVVTGQVVWQGSAQAIRAETMAPHR
jgi:ABC-type branched-subunit amino acid transport system ATPase component